MIRPDVLSLGLMVTPNLQVAGADDEPVEDLWYVALLLKGVWREATAVPELRVHTQRLARHLLTRLGEAIAKTLAYTP